MTALELLLADGQHRKVIVRRPGKATLQHNPNAAAEEFRILQIVQAAGIAAQTPYLLDQTGTILGEPLLVMGYVEGEPDFAPTSTAGRIPQMAALLAQIHSIDGSRAELSFLPRQAQRLAGAFQQRPIRLDDSLDEARIRATLEAVWPLPQTNAPTLTHGDFWPGNLLWKDDQLVAVIDWEDAEVGEPLADLAVTRLDLLWVYDRDAMQAFTRHYHSLSRLDFTHLPYWDLVASLRPAGRLDEWAVGWPELGRPDIDERTMREGHRWFVAQAFEKLPGLVP